MTVAASALLYRNDLKGWANGQIAHFGLSKDDGSRSRGGPDWSAGGLCGLGWPPWLQPASLVSQGPLASDSPGATRARVMLGCRGGGGRLVPWDPPRLSASPDPLLPLGCVRGRTQRGCGRKDLKAAKQLFCNLFQVVIFLSSLKDPNTPEVLGKIELVAVFTCLFGKLRKMGKKPSSWEFFCFSISVSGFIYTIHQEVSHQQHYLS